MSSGLEKDIQERSSANASDTSLEFRRLFELFSTDNHPHLRVRISFHDLLFINSFPLQKFSLMFDDASDQS